MPLDTPNLSVTHKPWLDRFLYENQAYITAFLLLWSLACLFLIGLLDKGDGILWLAQYRHPWLTSFFIFCTQLGEGYVYILALLLCLGIHYAKSLAFILNAITVLLISQALKVLFEHERPYRYFTDLLKQPELPNYIPEVVLHDGWTTSFPSGHTTSAFAFYTLLAFFFPNKKWFQALCLLCAFLVGCSRMYLVQHFLKDTTTGMLTGFLIAVLVYGIYARFLETRFEGALRRR